MTDNNVLFVAGAICKHLDCALDQSKVMTAARSIATHFAAQGQEAEKDSGTPGPWYVRKLERDGELRDCFVAAPDCQGFAYDAEILGDDEYRDGDDDGSGLRRKLADCELIVKAVNAARSQPPRAQAQSSVSEYDMLSGYQDWHTSRFDRSVDTERDAGCQDAWKSGYRAALAQKPRAQAAESCAEKKEGGNHAHI